MWFPLALTAMLMLVVRRGTETKLSRRIPASAMAWLQQFVMLPFLALFMLMPAAHFYSLAELSMQFYWVLAAYTAVSAVDLVLYFKAISLGNISVLSSVLSLAVVSNLIGVYVFLGQTPSQTGLLACALILFGAFLASRRLVSPDDADTAAHKLALVLMLVVVVLRGLYSPMEITAMRETDPFFFNLTSSLAVVPVVMAVAYWRGRRSGKPAFGKPLLGAINKHRLGLLIIGLTFAINLTCTYVGKTLTDNAAYVTTVKSASVLPMMILGVVMFNEHVRKRQWLGLVFILAGLVLFSQA